jgi:hypothetical protein
MSPRGASTRTLRTRFSRRLGDVLLARQDLQEPQAEEDDRERDERDAAQHGHPQGHLGRDRRAAFLE